MDRYRAELNPERGHEMGMDARLGKRVLSLIER
jgi:hypothetical protein